MRALVAPAICPGVEEARLIEAFFDGFTGVFVDVGANEPVIGSQSYGLERLGWSGLLVEPLAEYAAKLAAQRTAKVICAAAGAPEDEGKQLPLLVAGGLSTLSAEIKSGVQPSEVRQTPVRTLDSMLAEAGLNRVDFLSIDVEGHEIDVLRGFSINRLRPKLVLIEDDVHDLRKHRYMTARGYKLVRRTVLNNWYVPRGTPFPVSLFGRWQLFRKLRLGTPLRRWRHRLAHRMGRRP